ncbi:hypothetical protein OHB12_14590 [Nocardia sp. NBC_01730]|uniref:hypothetical protein n=1 Tax=Nocardia sp. NBC_01730 TaxID=2975998 RepID=UPI002E0FC683|nr:hypothetical protein OHB12_14590 [Nocardia sp. NBC_01730]
MEWGDHQKFPGNRSATGAGLAVYQGALYCAHRGSPDEYLWYSAYDGEKSWKEGVSFPGSTKRNANPAIAVYNDRLRCVFRGTDNAVYHKILNDSPWGDHAKVGSPAGDGPALAVYKNHLHCVFRGRDDKKLFHNFYNGSSWNGHANLGTTADGQPGLAVYHDKHTDLEQLFLVFRGA